ncbi:L-aspartate oxidase [Aquabacter sp. L1I39]|uniref:L-aspartate oxidase n=1 Tax=Aquabacter sp. L1I39 TaxID=2820278 RepID=UPI001ADB8023|nr:L-aspartate oxidase [Aquabacter sp. L1I39]QTL02893.1 L-aspartate oxidase [Aquabacter sp. L1I39]
MADPNDRILIVGAGIAGAATALALAPLPVLVVAPTGVSADAATTLAQGGIAAALGPDDDPTLHAADTHAAGAGLCEAEAVARVTAEGPAIIARLAALGIRFDTDESGALALGLEAAHGRSRIVHANEDATGRAVLEGLIAKARIAPHISRRADLVAVRLEAEDGRVHGLWCRDHGGRLVHLSGRAVVLATGGIGGLYASTTNPRSAVGSGLAMAARAGAVLRDLEFVQFHPTAIATASDPMPLATEALRGAGAILVDETGARFMADVPGRELAPRDVVARAIHDRIRGGHRVFLDARPALGAHFARHFPSVAQLCRTNGIDPERDAIPVRPAAHYHMGGIKVDGTGRTSLAGLYACGEVASTGLHGANRLASNSLLEALAYAQWIAADIAHRQAHAPVAASAAPADGPPAGIEAVRALMESHVGVVREGDGLRRALRLLAPRMAQDDAALVAGLVTLGALERTESRGGHFRADHPATGAPRHSEITLPAAAARLAAHAEHALREAV